MEISYSVVDRHENDTSQEIAPRKELLCNQKIITDKPYSINLHTIARAYREFDLSFRSTFLTIFLQ